MKMHAPNRAEERAKRLLEDAEMLRAKVCSGHASFRLNELNAVVYGLARAGAETPDLENGALKNDLYIMAGVCAIECNWPKEAERMFAAIRPQRPLPRVVLSHA